MFLFLPRTSLAQLSSRWSPIEEAILDLFVGLLLREAVDLCAREKPETSDSIQSSDASPHCTTKRDF
jgi:hypothetical protein